MYNIIIFLISHLTRKLETFDDYVDDADNSTHNVTADKLTKLVSTKRKPKVTTYHRCET